MLMKKFIGKPYAGKSHVRIDEGAGKVDLPLPALLYRLPPRNSARTSSSYLFKKRIRIPRIEKLINPENSIQLLITNIGDIMSIPHRHIDI